MKVHRSISLRFWLPLLVSSLFVTLFSIMSWQTYQHLELEFHAASLRFVTYDMASLQREMEKEFNGGDLLHAEQALAARGVHSEYQSLVAINAEGLILYATRLDLKGQQITQALPEFDTQRFTRLQKAQRSDVYLDHARQKITAYFPLRLVRRNDEIRPSHTGTLFLVYDISEGHAGILRQLERTILPLGILLFFSMMVLIGFLHYFVTRPTQHLAEIAEDLARGKMGLQSKIHGHGELAMLGNAFNLMSVQIKAHSEKHQKIEETLRDNEERLRAIYEQSNDAILLLDLEQDRIIDFNQKAVTLLGYPREDLFHIPVSTIHARDIDELKDFSQSIFDEGGKTREISCFTKKGEFVPAEVSASHVEIKGKTYLLCFVRDITERKRFDEELLRYKHIVSSTPDMLALLDRDYVYLAANAAYLNAFDRTEDEVIGQTPTDVFGEVFFKKMIKPRADRCMVGGNVRYQDWIDFPGTGRKYMDVSFSAHRDQNKKVIGFVVNARDLTESKQAEEKHANLEAHLRQNQKLEAIGMLAGGVAHEINNPITGIMSYAQLINDRLDPESPLREFAEEIGRESERVAEIVRNLLAFARQEKEGHSLANISDILNNTLTLIRTIIRRDQIALNVDVSDDLPKLKCRSQQIQQVLMNLFTNARDALNSRYPAHDPDKVMTVTVRPFKKEGRQWIRITIEDHGIGIPDEIRDHLFDPFFTTKDRSLGTGLGLSISHGIVQDHHGRLYFESETGQYTRFHLDLPVDNGWKTNADFGARNGEDK